jgi:hypothetical protein
VEFTMALQIVYNLFIDNRLKIWYNIITVKERKGVDNMGFRWKLVLRFGEKHWTVRLFDWITRGH